MLSMVKQLNQSLDLEQILEHMLANLKRILSYDSAEIAILNDDKLNLISQIRSTLQPEFISKLTHDKRIEEHSFYLQMQQTGKPILINDMSSSSVSITQDMGHQVKSFLGMPIISNDETLGFINVNKHESGFFSQKDIQHLEAFAEHASLSIKNARLHQTAQELAVLKERQRLASDLHDSVSQVIFSLCITAESQARMIEKGDYVQVKALSEIIRLSAANVHAEMSLLMLELRPMSLSTSTLADLLKQLVIGTLGRYTSVEIETIIEKTPTLAIEPKNAIFRILQEALNNVVKHAGAGKVTVKLLSQDDTIHLTIEDDGHGFDPETQAPGIGLHIMRERATKIGSELKIKSSKDKGTCITLTYQIP
jgi:NarL family two-component system sensor histidine kinase LiaS